MPVQQIHHWWVAHYEQDTTRKGILAALKQVVESGDVGAGLKLQYAQASRGS
ncbi:hypothetical protein ACWEIJ_15605 [Lentzea sp. NPDC004789]